MVVPHRLGVLVVWRSIVLSACLRCMTQRRTCMESVTQYILSWCIKGIQGAQAAYSVVVAVEVMTYLSSREPSHGVLREDYNWRLLVLS